MDELQKQFDYYVTNQDALVEKYRGKYVVIANESVVETFDSEMGAYAFATERFVPGTFMIQLVMPGKENYSQTFHSRVAI